MIDSANRRAPLASGEDPRTAHSAEVIDLATRHVLPAVARPPRRRDALGGLGAVAVVALIGGVTFWNLDHARVETSRAPPAVASPGLGLVPTPALAPPAFPAAAITPLPAPSATMPMRNPRLQPANNTLASPTLVYDSAALPEAARGPDVPAPTLAGGGPPANAGDEFAARLGATGTAGTSASAAINPATTIAQGTLIPAVLETAIDTDVPGYVRAIVASDVRSFDGTHVLVPRSSRLIGQYKSGLTGGQARVYVIWTRLIRPDGVAVNLGSPATGIDGQSGLAGSVNSHFFSRFGSAMLLTVLSGLATVGSGGASVVLAGGGQSAAAAAVGQTGQIGPTLRVHPGEPVRVFTAHDLDFAGARTP